MQDPGRFEPLEIGSGSTVLINNHWDFINKRCDATAAKWKQRFIIIEMQPAVANFLWWSPTRKNQMGHMMSHSDNGGHLTMTSIPQKSIIPKFIAIIGIV